MKKETNDRDTRGNFNLEELAAYMGVSGPTAQRLVNQPGFPALRVGRRWICPRQAVDEWLMQNAKERAQL